MIDFILAEEIAIPEGVTVKITSGAKTLWEKSGLLPSAYQQVAYIATDGNQYFDTGIMASDYPNGIRYVFCGNVTKYQSTQNIYWFGALGNSCRSGNFGSRETYLCLFVGGTGNYYSALSRPSAGEDFEVIVQGTSKDAKSCIATYNGEQLSTHSGLVNSEMPSANIYLLTCSNTSAASTANMKYYGKIYSFTMDSVDGTPLRNFVPCYRKSDGVIGLYDTVGKTFYINKGTGAFTKGANV